MSSSSPLFLGQGARSAEDGFSSGESARGAGGRGGEGRSRVAARERANGVDTLVQRLAGNLDAAHATVAIVALGAYGRRELTPRGDVDVLFLYDGHLEPREVTQAVCYPLWEQSIRVEPTVRSLAECVADARRSWTAVTGFLDARFVGGDKPLALALLQQITLPWRRDLGRLRHRVKAESTRRHLGHASAATSTTPDLVAGRGGMLDLNALRWLDTRSSAELEAALEFHLQALTAAELFGGPAPHRLSARVQERIAAALHTSVDELADELARHARWVAFTLDNALAPARADRQLGPSLLIRDGHLTANRLPPLARAPSIGLRVANLVGLAPPDRSLLDWATAPSNTPITWDESALDQLWLMLRAADWRAWEFLDVSNLLQAYLPELNRIRRRRDLSSVEDQTLDSHSFLAVRRLHEWTDTDAPLAQRAWRALRRRDDVYLAVLLHELEPTAADAAVHRLNLPDDVGEHIQFAIGGWRTLLETATRRDLHDEEMVLQLAAQIGSRRRLSVVFLVAIAHELATHPAGWRGWQLDLLRQLHLSLDAALRQPRLLGARHTRAIERHRERIVRELNARDLSQLASIVQRLPRRYVLAHSPTFVMRHLSLLSGARLVEGEVRLRTSRHRQRGLWDVQIAARDRPGLLATMAGVFALRGVSVLAADASTTGDGLALNVFTVTAASGAPLDRASWSALAHDVRSALDGRLPLADLLGARPLPEDDAEAIQVTVDNAGSQFFTILEVRAPDQVGLLYRIADALHALELDIQQARIATRPEGALDVFYVRDLAGEKLDEATAARAASATATRLRGQRLSD